MFSKYWYVNTFTFDGINVLSSAGQMLVSGDTVLMPRANRLFT